MIGSGEFADQLNRIEALLKLLDLLAKREYYPNRKLGAPDFRGLSYREVWEKSIQQFAFDFQLFDHSLLFFTKVDGTSHTGALSFGYLDAPLRLITYQEFVAELLDISPFDADFRETMDKVGDDLLIDYDTYASTCEAKNPVTPLRYDYKASDYRSGCHPASHLHFGFDTEIRIATRKVLTPLSFVLFVIRQCYPEKWSELLELNADRVLFRIVRDSLDDIHKDYWQERDLHEMWLT